MDGALVVISRKSSTSTGDRGEGDVILAENYSRVEASATIRVQLPEEAIPARDQRAAAVLVFEAQVGQISERYRLAADESVSNRASAESDDFAGCAIAPDTDLKEIPANVAGIIEAGLTLEGHTDLARNRAIP